MLHWHVAKVQWIPLEIRWIAVLSTCGKAHRAFSSNSHATERWDDRKVHRVQKGVWMSYISLKHYSLINNINDTYWADYFSTDCWIDSESGCLTFGLKNKKLQTWLAKIASVMSTSCVGTYVFSVCRGFAVHMIIVSGNSTPGLLSPLLFSVWPCVFRGGRA